MDDRLYAHVTPTTGTSFFFGLFVRIAYALATVQKTHRIVPVAHVRRFHVHTSKKMINGRGSGGGTPPNMDDPCCFGRRVLGLPDHLLAMVMRRVRRSALRAMFAASKELSRAARLGVTHARLGRAFSDAVDLRWLGSFRQLSDAFPGLKTIKLDGVSQERVADLLVYEYECVDLLRRCRELSVNSMPSARVVLPDCHDLLRLELRFDGDFDTYEAVMDGDRSCEVPLDSLTKLTTLRCMSYLDDGLLACDTFPVSLTDLTVEFEIDPAEVFVLGRRLTNLRRLCLLADYVCEPDPRPKFPNLLHFTCLTSELCDNDGMAFLARAMPPSLESLELTRTFSRERPRHVTDIACWTTHCPRLSSFTFDMGDAPVPDLHLAECIAGMSCLTRLQVCGNRSTALLAASLERLRLLDRVVVDERWDMVETVEGYRVASGARWKVRGTYPGILSLKRRAADEDTNVRILEMGEYAYCFEDGSYEVGSD